MFRARTVRGGNGLEATVGTVLGGRYRVESRLGSGGMAVVYKAEDSILGRTVALKTLHERFAEVPSFRRRFRQEARAMASLDHENIVKVYDISHDGEVPFIVAECVGGRDVGSMLSEARDGRLGEPVVRRLAEQLLRALAYAHRRGVIHRDIKPSNILLTADGMDGMVKVADFGIARLVKEDDAEDGEIVGSARYMSPEQLMGKEVRPQSDLYSVGVLLYHCLTGRPPFSGDVNSLANQHVRKEPTPPRKLNRKISPQMEAVILRALAKDPEDRYPSAYAMLDDIEAEAAPKARPNRRAARAAAPSGKRGPGRRALVLVPALALLLAGGGAALASSMGALDLRDVPSGATVEGWLNPVEEVRAKAPPAEPKAEKAAEDEPAKEDKEQPQNLVAVPELVPYYDDSAQEILFNRGFEAEIVYGYQEGFANRGVTWASEPAAGEMVPAGSTITVYATPREIRRPPQLGG